MSDPTSADRVRRFRARQAGLIPPAAALVCTTCGKQHTGAHGALCRDCWRRTPEGREWQRVRMADYRKRTRNP